MKKKIIFAEWIAAALVQKGYNPLIRPDKKDKNRMVYIFIVTDEFSKDLDDVLKRG